MKLSAHVDYFGFCHFVQYFRRSAAAARSYPPTSATSVSDVSANLSGISGDVAAADRDTLELSVRCDNFVVSDVSATLSSISGAAPPPANRPAVSCCRRSWPPWSSCGTRIDAAAVTARSITRTTRRRR